jgi:hypothetical protein
MTVDFQPVHGKNARIDLTRAGVTDDVFSIVELDQEASKKKLLTAGSKGRLQLVEIELQEAIIRILFFKPRRLHSKKRRDFSC